MATPIVKTSAEFKDTVTSIIRAMALDEFLLVPKSYIEDGINAWLEKNKETGECPAQEDYKCYYQFIMTIPPEMHVLDMDLYFLRVARRIVDNILLAMLETSYSITQMPRKNNTVLFTRSLQISWIVLRITKTVVGYSRTLKSCARNSKSIIRRY